MYTKDDILKQLRAGTSAEDIAASMAETLNSAIGEFQQEAAKKARDTERFNDALAIVDAFNAFDKKWFGYGDTPTAEANRAMAETVIRMFETGESIFGCKAKTDSAKDDDDLIKEFLKIFDI